MACLGLLLDLLDLLLGDLDLDLERETDLLGGVLLRSLLGGDLLG